MIERDYNRTNSKQVFFGPKWNDYYTITDYKRRVTTKTHKSPRKNGKLMKVQGPVERSWRFETGTFPIRQVKGTDGVWGSSYPGIIMPAGSTHDLYLATQSLFPAARNKAAERFHSRVEERIILGMEYILERKSLIDYLVSGLNFVKDIVVACKKRKFKTLKKYDPRRKKITFKRVEMSWHEKWLEYHFSLAPMMQDIYNTVNDIAPMPIDFVRTRATESSNKFLLRETRDETSWFKQEASVRVTYSGYATVSDPAAFVGNQIGLDPGKFIYDAITLSFVLEWFWNIGKWIDHLSTPGMTISDVWETTLRKCKSNYDGVWHPQERNPVLSYRTVGSGFTYYDATYSRVKTGGLPEIKIMWQGGVDSLWRVVTSIALIRSIFSSK